MKINNNSELIGYGFLALVAAIFIYHCWRWLLGALAIFGLVFIISIYQRNNRNRPPHC